MTDADQLRKETEVRRKLQSRFADSRIVQIDEVARDADQLIEVLQDECASRAMTNDRLTAENASLVQERDEAATDRDFYHIEYDSRGVWIGELQAQLTTAQAALATARRDALEEAAKEADILIDRPCECISLWPDDPDPEWYINCHCKDKQCIQGSQTWCDHKNISKRIRALATRATPEN